MKVKISCHPLTEDEKKEFGVFISHSNDNDLFKTVCEALEQAGVPHLVDKQIAVAAMDFASEIKNLIDRCKVAIVVITEGALKSSWVNFEIGVLQGEGKRILLYDPNHLLSEGCGYHLDKFPIYYDLDKIVAASKETGLYSGLFEHSTKKLTKELFEARVEKNTLSVKLKLTLPGLEDLHLETCTFRALLVTFGSYDCKYGEDNICFQTFDEEKVCPITNKLCALNHFPEYEEYIECVVLNKVMDKAIVNRNDVTIVLPLHKVFGTKFKMFADIYDSKESDRLFELLEQCELKPSKSKSANGQRIYFSLTDSNWEGVFRLKNRHRDNFLCPAIMEAD